MKTGRKILLIAFVLFIFLICDQIRVSANADKEVIESNLNIENLIEYINNLDLTEEEIRNVSEKSKTISQDIKGKTSFKDYKLKDIINIYRNFTSMSNDLKLNIDFSIKNGDFTLKDKANDSSLFKGNVSEIKKYFEAIKSNTELLSTELADNVENEDIKNKIEEVINSMAESKIEAADNTQQMQNDTEEIQNYDKNITENDVKHIIENEKVGIENDLVTNKGNDIILPISILAIAFSVIVISYIKFK